MAQRSVIRLTGQNWKLAVGVLALLVGSILPAFDASGMSWTTGTVLACIGYAFACLAVRCPACGHRWVWAAQLDAGLYGPLFKDSACPKCRRDYADKG